MASPSPRLMRAGRLVAWVFLALVVLVGGVLLGVPGVRQLASPRTTVIQTMPTPAGFVAPSPVAVPDSPLLPALPGVAPPPAAAVAARLPALPAGLAGARASVVADAATGTVLARVGNRPLLPASTMKLLTGFAALDVLQPGTRFATRAVLVGSGRVVLVGGGDPLLATKPTADRASLTELADATAAALKQQGRTKVTLGYDASRFTGPAWNPTWQPNYRYAVAPVSALVVDHARTATGLRAGDPARAAAATFRKLLAARGITAAAPSASSGTKGTPLAQVDSPPVERLLEVMLRNSDNDVAEVMLRQVGVAAGRPGTTADGARVARERLRARGLWADGMRIADGSGLSRNDRVTPAVLVKIVALGLRDPRFRTLATGLPVGGVAGTLAERFDDKDEVAGRGTVRAKTGTLRDVAALAGYVVTRDGAVLAYAVLTNKVTRVRAAEDWLDRTSAALASCGCG